jgi:GH24 family phage-related lysozyme (muramidase)
MHISDRGISLIKKYEGCRLSAYKCAAGVPTIGYGHTAGVKMGDKITQAQAEQMLKSDLVVYENHVKSLKRNFNQNEFDALVSFCYNCGIGCLKTLCKNRTNAQIAEALLLYNKANGKVLEGLNRRRKEERDLFLNKQSINEATKTVNKLPYKVKTKCDLNIRSGAGVNHSKIRVALKGEILTIWAIETNDTTKWGKNGKEYFSLSYCEEI